MAAKLRATKIRGDFSATGLRFGIVVSRFNEVLTERLLEGALDTLESHGARARDVFVVRVPGAFELALAAKKLIRAERPDAVLALAVVIRGQTRHFDQVVRESAAALRELMMKAELPVILGVVPAENESQALARVGLKQMNKGREWALSAIEMASLLKKLERRPRR